MNKVKGFLAGLVAKIRRNPVVLIHTVTAILSCAASLGLQLTPDQTAAVMGVAQFLASFLARSKVTPMKTLVQPIDGCQMGPGERDS